MLEIDVLGWRQLHLQTVVMDVNGTLSTDGELLPIQSRIRQLRERVEVCLISADTHDTLAAIGKELGVRAIRLQPGGNESEQKSALVREMGADSVAAIGNGANDVGMFEASAVSVVIVGEEGCAVRALTASDIVVRTAEEALDLFLNPTRLMATLRR